MSVRNLKKIANLYRYSGLKHVQKVKWHESIGVIFQAHNSNNNSLITTGESPEIHGCLKTKVTTKNTAVV